MISSFRHEVFYLVFSGEFDFVVVHLVHFVFVVVASGLVVVWDQMANPVPVGPVAMVVAWVLLVLVTVVVVVRHQIANPVPLVVVVWVCCVFVVVFSVVLVHCQTMRMMNQRTTMMRTVPPSLGFVLHQVPQAWESV